MCSSTQSTQSFSEQSRQYPLPLSLDSTFLCFRRMMCTVNVLVERTINIKTTVMTHFCLRFRSKTLDLSSSSFSGSFVRSAHRATEKKKLARNTFFWMLILKKQTHSPRTHCAATLRVGGPAFNRRSARLLGNPRYIFSWRALTTRRKKVRIVFLNSS